MRGTKEFDWVITPAHSGAQDVPEIRYPFFNPYTERYELAVSPPQHVAIAPGTLAATDSASSTAPPPLPVRMVMRPPVDPSPSDDQRFWLVIGLAPLPALVFGAVRRPRARRVAPPEQRLKHLARPGAGAIDPPVLRRAYAEAIIARVGGVTAGLMSDRAALIRTLRRSGVTDEGAQEVEALLEQLDAAVYSPDRTLDARAAERAYALWQRVDAEAKPHPVPGGGGATTAAIAVLFLLAGARLGAAQRVDPAVQDAFDRGVQAYQGRRFAEAERFFAEAAKREPRAADAWANFGTAAWSAHDTAAAAVGWQRAIRLDPVAAEVRERLGFTAGYQSATVTGVPPVTTRDADLAAAASWILAWVLAAIAVLTNRRAVRRAAWAVGVIAVVAGLIALQTHQAVRATRLAVVVETARLRSLPALGGDEGAPVLVGEVARTLSAQGVWTRVRMPDDREGWIESERLERIGVE